MVSIEVIRRYPFFAGFSFEQLTDLAQAADEVSGEAGYQFFHEGDYLGFTLELQEDSVVSVMALTSFRAGQDDLHYMVPVRLLTLDEVRDGSTDTLDSGPGDYSRLFPAGRHELVASQVDRVQDLPWQEGLMIFISDRPQPWMEEWFQDLHRRADRELNH